MEEKTIVDQLGALAQPHRLRIFRALVVVGQSGLTPGTLADSLGLAAATLSFHLKELTRSALVTQTRDGRNLIYRADFDQMNALITYLSANCCEGPTCP